LFLTINGELHFAMSLHSLTCALSVSATSVTTQSTVYSRAGLILPSSNTTSDPCEVDCQKPQTVLDDVRSC
jgi:hypothetical protein